MIPVIDEAVWLSNRATDQNKSTECVQLLWKGGGGAQWATVGLEPLTNLSLIILHCIHIQDHVWGFVLSWAMWYVGRETVASCTHFLLDGGTQFIQFKCYKLTYQLMPLTHTQLQTDLVYSVSFSPDNNVASFLSKILLYVIAIILIN